MRSWQYSYKSSLDTLAACHTQGSRLFWDLTAHLYIWLHNGFFVGEMHCRSVTEIQGKKLGLLLWIFTLHAADFTSFRCRLASFNVFSKWFLQGNRVNKWYGTYCFCDADFKSAPKSAWKSTMRSKDLLTIVGEGLAFSTEDIVPSGGQLIVKLLKKELRCKNSGYFISYHLLPIHRV